MQSEMVSLSIQIHAPKKEWTPKNVVEWITACRRDRGIPQFRTDYGNVPYQVDGKPAVFAVCWGGDNTVGSYLFYKVPKEDIDLMKNKSGEWKILLEKYKKKTA